MSKEKMTVASLDAKAIKTEKIPVSFGDMAYSLLATGDIYWVKVNQQLVKIFYAGDYLLPDIIEKFKKGNRVLVIDQIANVGLINSGITEWEKFKKADNDLEIFKHRKSILFWFSQVYWSGEKRGSLLDLAILGQKEFYSFAPEITEKLKKIGLDNLKRSFLYSALAVYIALAMGHTDYRFLKDVYNVCFLLDYAFNDDSISYNISQAMEMERKKGGEGQRYLFQNENPTWEFQAFTEHPERGIQNALEECLTYFSNPDVIQVILRQHERMDGSGFPTQTNESELSDLENIIIALNHLVPYQHLDYQHGDGQSYLRNSLMQAGEGQEEGNFWGERLRGVLGRIFSQLGEPNG
ncbi:MAG: hypothetical protein WCG27_00695 [Pseudomonadota bacterium]